MRCLFIISLIIFNGQTYGQKSKISSVIEIQNVEKRKGSPEYHYANGKFEYLENNFLQISPAIGFGESASLSFSLLLAKRFTPRFAFGLGTGIISMSTNKNFTRYQFLDAYFYSRYLINKIDKLNKWYISGKIGYAIKNGINRTSVLIYQDGPMSEIGFGLHLPSRAKTRISLELLYRLQYSKGISPKGLLFFDFQKVMSFTHTEDRLFFRSLARLNIEIG